MSVVRLLVLGAIKRRQSAHGYRILRDLTAWRVETWTMVRPGSLYHAIAQLERQGLIAGAEELTARKLGPARTAYALTGAGEQAFQQLLEVALKSMELEQNSAAIAFMEFLPRARVIALLAERAQAQRAVPAFLATLPVDKRPAEPSRHPELMRLWSDHFAAAAATTEQLIAALQAGQYVFLGEEDPR